MNRIKCKLIHCVSSTHLESQCDIKKHNSIDLIVHELDRTKITQTVQTLRMYLAEVRINFQNAILLQYCPYFFVFNSINSLSNCFRYYPTAIIYKCCVTDKRTMNVEPCQDDTAYYLISPNQYVLSHLIFKIQDVSLIFPPDGPTMPDTDGT